MIRNFIIIVHTSGRRILSYTMEEDREALKGGPNCDYKAVFYVSEKHDFFKANMQEWLTDDLFGNYKSSIREL